MNYSGWDLFGAFLVGLFAGGFIGLCVGHGARLSARASRGKNGRPAFCTDADDQPQMCEETVDGRSCTSLAVFGAHYCRAHIGPHL